ncbi:SCO family protein [Deinococcus enclensis]|uniref:Protein SCO1/2 n=1 Tax=Deinococcus enclensis TaxID=1049582 RepID=A0ABT9MEL8_9DEIO|nr:SCO family protein [Deinococcus enclensis]MDP9765019.1 protein SCO1/2 [Deinococcus enclensis]
MTTPHPDPLPELTPDALAPRPWYVSALLALSAVVLLIAGAWGVARLRSPYPFYGTAYPNTQAAALTGTDHTGRPWTFTPGETGGAATAIFFGFTHCPNICPLSLANLSRARDTLPPADRARLKILMVSVDPDRDTPQRLKEYVTYFGEGTGVNIPEPTLSAVAKQYGVGYQKADIKSAAEYQVNHTTATYLVDAAGKLRVLWDYSQLPQTARVAQDMQYVIRNPAR